MIQFLFNRVLQVPPWARADYPLLRHELGKQKRVSFRTRVLRVLILSLIAGTVLGLSLLYVQNNPPDAGATFFESLHRFLYWPIILLQFGVSLMALALTMNTVESEMRNQNWDHLRVTAQGAAFAMRTRMASVFYRLAPLLIPLMLMRLVLVFGMIYELTAFQGHYLDLMLGTITPPVPLIAGVLLLALLLTGVVIVPLTSVYVFAALGLLISITLRQRLYTSLVLLFFSVAWVVLFLLVQQEVGGYLNENIIVASDRAWLMLAGFSALGDWGLSFLNLTLFGEIWATLPYGILLSLVPLGVSALQLLVAEGAFRLTSAQAERAG